MKKLMIALAAVVSAVALQAASVNWNFSVSGADSNWDPAVGSVTIAALSSSWTEAFDPSGLANFSISGSTDAGGVFAAGTSWTVTMTAKLSSEDTLKTGDYVYSYVFNMASLPSDDPSIQSALSAVADEITNAFIDGSTGALPTIEAATAAGWTAAPEPTSGLLLLLGVAGLALKRKRA